ncbi:hemolysin III family protein [Bifidobacterium vespertilionis]|nr:hemolysin III family protein [Bifidobacterium vespertilionis]
MSMAGMTTSTNPNGTREREVRERIERARQRVRQATEARKAAQREERLLRHPERRNRPERDYIAKPRLRGVMHLITFPLAVAASIVLICVAPWGSIKAACAVYGATAMLLFGNSSLLHIGHWGPRMNKVLCQIDYCNIFLIIAGTNTPFLFALDERIRRPYLIVIWAAALIGSVAHVIWYHNHDWIFTMIYIVLDLAPVTLIPFLWTAPAVGPAATILIAAGGAAYIAGAVCFAQRKPNPVPGWFGYHEVFHLGTVAGYACHVVAVYLTVCAMR